MFEDASVARIAAAISRDWPFLRNDMQCLVLSMSKQVVRIVKKIKTEAQVLWPDACI